MGRSWRSIRIITGLFCALALTQFVGKHTSAQAADTVVVRFGLFSRSIAVADLQTAANTGQFPPNLTYISNSLPPEQRSLLLSALNIRIPLNVATVSRLLNTQIGTTVLNDLSTAVVRKDNAGIQALRAAFVLGARNPEGLSILDFIAAYPNERLEINLPQAFAVVRTLNLGFWTTQQFMLTLTSSVSSSDIVSLIKPKKPEISIPFDPSQAGNAQVRVLELLFHDQKRQRNIPIDIYWSTAITADKPVIIFSHGFGSVRTDMRYLAEHLASHGYVVAALEHPGSNSINVNLAIQNKTRLFPPQEIVDRPQDISFVLDELEKLNKMANIPLQGKLATNNTLILGYSYGGGTALAIAGGELQLERLKQRCKNNISVFSLGETLQCSAQELPKNTYQLRDTRIKRAIAFSPTTSLLFGDTGLSQVQVPTLVLASSADKTTPALSEQIVGFAKIPSPKWLVGILGSTHLSVKDPSTTMDQAGKPNTPFFGGEVVGEDAAEVRKYVRTITLAFAAQMTPEAEKYAIFLTPEYAQFASTPRFPIRLTTDIPPEALALVKQFAEK
jgi:predicted dienelactone hydrolase